jgi:hypothetical protein
MAASLVLVGVLLAFPLPVSAQPQAVTLPDRLTDEQFWKLSAESSEPDGEFRSDNLLSNETSFQWVINDLLRASKEGRVYMGVGPEQNFTYIAALKPAMVFIVDIRRGNLDLHLMYKALFELSNDRADFVSRLFSRKRPAGLTRESTAAQIFGAISAEDGKKELYQENLKAIEDHLMTTHGFPLSEGDREGIAWALSNFYLHGPSISYNSSLSTGIPPFVVGANRGGFGRGGGNNVDYFSLMTATDERGQSRSYLANEENFGFLKDLQTRNLLIPVVGDFGGGKAIRAVAQYLKDTGAMISAFYLSNVEQYLTQDGKWEPFCFNVATLPLDENSMFIRSGRGGPNTISQFGAGGVQNSSIAPILSEVAACRPSAR